MVINEDQDIIIVRIVNKHIDLSHRNEFIAAKEIAANALQEMKQDTGLCHIQSDLLQELARLYVDISIRNLSN